MWPPERESGLDRVVVPAVHGAFHAVTRRILMTSNPHGMNATDALVLATLRLDSGCAPWEIRHRTGLRRSTLASILDRLEKDDRIERSRVSFDGRRFSVKLTAAGQISADIAGALISEVEAEIAGYTSPAERRGAAAVYEACLAIGQRDRRPDW
jgi:DNA-binding MarR family transcriptional regulator